MFDEWPLLAAALLIVFQETDLEDRMDMLLDYARDLDVLNFVTPRDIIKGNIKLNTAFIAQLFNAFPSLEVDDQEDQLDDFDEMQYNDQTEMFFEETREEKSMFKIISWLDKYQLVDLRLIFC